MADVVFSVSSEGSPGSILIEVWLFREMSSSSSPEPSSSSSGQGGECVPDFRRLLRRGSEPLADSWSEARARSDREARVDTEFGEGLPGGGVADRALLRLDETLGGRPLRTPFLLEDGESDELGALFVVL